MLAENMPFPISSIVSFCVWFKMQKKTINFIFLFCFPSIFTLIVFACAPAFVCVCVWDQMLNGQVYVLPTQKILLYTQQENGQGKAKMKENTELEQKKIMISTDFQQQCEHLTERNNVFNICFINNTMIIYNIYFT